MRLLGIDYGQKKIGLAMSEGELATPYGVLKIAGLEDAINKISKIIDQEEIDQVVIGQPESGESLKMVEKFIKQLRERLKKGVEVVVVDETLSTQQAQHVMRQLNLKKRAVEDAYAAAAILQDYLDLH